VNTRINEVQVKIQEDTQYPFDNLIRFNINPEKKKQFTLAIRNPYWSRNTQVKSIGAIIKQADGYIYVSKEWRAGDICEVEFEPNIEAQKTQSNEFYFTRGPLIYSLPIPDVRQVTKEFKNGLKNWDIMPENIVLAEDVFANYKVQPNVDINLKNGQTKFKFIKNDQANMDYPFDQPFGFVEVELIKEKNPFKVKLLPYGSTTLRKTSFPENK